MSAWGPERKPTREDGIHQVATSCIRRLLELGLPEAHALLARDLIKAGLGNYTDRLMAGEWEPR